MNTRGKNNERGAVAGEYGLLLAVTAAAAVPLLALYLLFVGFSVGVCEKMSAEENKASCASPVGG